MRVVPQKVETVIGREIGCIANIILVVEYRLSAFGVRELSRQAERLSIGRRRDAHKTRKVTEGVVLQIETLLRQELSSQQVVDYLERHTGLSLHHETIYQLIYLDKAQGGDQYTHMRIASKPYRKRYGTYDRRRMIKNRLSIDDRPAVVDRRNRIGDWEGDTIIGKGRKCALLTMVERKTLYTVIHCCPVNFHMSFN